MHIQSTAKPMSTAATIVLFLGTLTTALIAGLFFAYSCSVNPGLGKLSDIQYLSTMQSINRAILNPAFLLTFMGAAFLLPISTYLVYGQSSSRFALVLAATIVYLIGVTGVTMVGNVPLNEALDKLSLSQASASDLSRYREAFEKPWNRLHGYRTFATIVSSALMIIACINPRMIQALFSADK